MKRTAEILDRLASSSVTTDMVFQVACEDVAEHTRANRVSVWHFGKDNDRIKCDCFYEADKGSYSKGQVLLADDHPSYFKAILTETFIDAADARDHPATAELIDPYFEEHDIYSLLDFIIHNDFKPVGIICCENSGARRDWDEKDLSYLRQISTLISFKFKFD